MMNVTLGIFVARRKPSRYISFDVLAGQRRLDRSVHHHLGEVPRVVVERLGPFQDRLAIGRVQDHLESGQHRLDLLALARAELFALDLIDSGARSDFSVARMTFSASFRASISSRAAKSASAFSNESISICSTCSSVKPVRRLDLHRLLDFGAQFAARSR